MGDGGRAPPIISSKLSRAPSARPAHAPPPRHVTCTTPHGVRTGGTPTASSRRQRQRTQHPRRTLGARRPCAPHRPPPRRSPRLSPWPLALPPHPAPSPPSHPSGAFRCLASSAGSGREPVRGGAWYKWKYNAMNDSLTIIMITVALSHLAEAALGCRPLPSSPRGQDSIRGHSLRCGRPCPAVQVGPWIDRFARVRRGGNDG